MLPLYSYALILGILAVSIYFAIKLLRLGPRSLGPPDVGNAIIVAVAAMNVIPALAVIVYAIGKGFEGCLPPYFGFTALGSIIVGSLAGLIYGLINLLNKFLDVLDLMPPEVE